MILLINVVIIYIILQVAFSEVMSLYMHQLFCWMNLYLFVQFLFFTIHLLLIVIYFWCNIILVFDKCTRILLNDL